MGIANFGKQVQEYEYDFSVDAGAIGAISLHSKDNKSVIPAGAIIVSVRALVLSALTSGGSAVLSWGNGDDADGYSGVALAVAGLGADVVKNGWDNGAVLLWDDTNDHMIDVYVADAAAGQMIFTIATAALTAGKVKFLVEYMLPSV